MSRSQHFSQNPASSITEFLRNHRASASGRQPLINGSSFVPPTSPQHTYTPAPIAMPASSRHRRPSTVTDTSTSTDPSSVFDPSSLPESNYSSSYPASTYSDVVTIPSTSGTIQPPPHIMLPCEFVGYAACNEYFHPVEVHQWMEHIISYHLRNDVPNKSACWYCDSHDFDASRDGVDRMNHFRNRLEHIRFHITEEGYGVADIRPDYAFTAHLRRLGLITQPVFDSVQSWREGPESGVTGIYAHDWEPPERQQQHGQSQAVYMSESPRERRSHKRGEGRHRSDRAHGKHRKPSGS